MKECNFSLILIVFFCMVEETSSKNDLPNVVSGGTEFGGTASNQNEIGWDPTGPRGFDVNEENGVVGSNYAGSKTGILSCFIVFAFDRKISQKAEIGDVVFDQNRVTVRENHGKDFKNVFDS